MSTSRILSTWRLVPALPLLAGVAMAQGTTRVSVDSSGAEGPYESRRPSISQDGGVVAFASYTSFEPEVHLDFDVFVRDRVAGTTECMSLTPTGGEADSDSDWPSISADGQLVAFFSRASNLVAGDTNGRDDVFVRDRATGTTERVSVDSAGNEGNGFSFFAAISADGRFVAFWSDSSNLVAGDTNGTYDVFVHDRVTGATERVSVDSAGHESNGLVFFNAPPSVSADGRFVAFESDASDLVANDANGAIDIFVRDRANGTTERVSVDPSGGDGDAWSFEPWLSADGSLVAFTSLASNLVAGDANGWGDVFVRDRTTGVTERVSIGPSGVEADSWSMSPAISADGSTVAFMSDANNLVAGETTPWDDVYVHDRVRGRTELVSVNSDGQAGNSYSAAPRPTGDGVSIAFESEASNLVADDFNRADVFVRERCVHDASWTSYGTGLAGALGVPAFTARQDPELGTALELDLANSAGAWTVGLLFVGFQRTTISSVWGADLLVEPTATLVIGIPPSGLVLRADLPPGDDFCGLVVDLQAIESDAGAIRGVSFTEGLELMLGH